MWGKCGENPENKNRLIRIYQQIKRFYWYPEPGSNRHGHYWPQDFKSGVSTDSTIRAASFRPKGRAKVRINILFCKKTHRARSARRRRFCIGFRRRSRQQEALPPVVMNPSGVELPFRFSDGSRITDRNDAQGQDSLRQGEIRTDGLHPFGIGIGRRPYAAQPERMGGQQDILGRSRAVQIPIRGTGRTSAHDHGARRLSQHLGIRQRCGQRIENRPFVHDDELPRPLILSRRGRHGGAQQQFDLLRLDGPVLIGADARALKNGLQRRIGFRRSGRLRGAGCDRQCGDTCGEIDSDLHFQQRFSCPAESRPTNRTEAVAYHPATGSFRRRLTALPNKDTERFPENDKRKRPFRHDSDGKTISGRSEPHPHSCFVGIYIMQNCRNKKIKL